MTTIFTGGYIFGPAFGGVIGTASRFLFSALNPWGSGLAFPPLIMAQSFYFGITGLAGGIMIPHISSFRKNNIRIFLYGLSGGLLTVLYHLFVSFFTTGYTGFTMS